MRPNSGSDERWGRTNYILSERWIRPKRKGSQRLWRRKRAYTRIHDPTVEQAEEEKAPKWLWRRIIPPRRRKTLWANLGRTDLSALVGNWPTRDNSDAKYQSFEVGRYEPSWQGENRGPSFDHMAVHMTLDRCGVVLMARSQVRTAPGPQPQKGSTSSYWRRPWFSCRQGRTE